MTKRNIQLLAIDPQNDFCDLPESYLPADPLRAGEVITPQLPVPGAHADMLRIAALINRAAAGITGITVPLDSHSRIGIERPAMWMLGDGSDMPVFTEVVASDVRNGTYLPRNPAHLPRVLAYLDALQAGGRYKLRIWTPHCELGSWGHNVHDAVRAAYNGWEDRGLGQVIKIIKGTNPWTEHYSAVQAEVPDESDPSTLLNRGLIEMARSADLLLIGGEAGSHCVPATTEHIVEQMDPASLSRIVLLRDCISAVAGCEGLYEDFLTRMRERGVRVATSIEMLEVLIANQAER